MNAAANRVRGLSTPGKIMLTVLVLAALTGFIVWIYYYRAYREHIMELSPYLIKGKANAMSEALSKRQFPLAYPKGTIANGFGFAYSTWIYVKDWQYNYGEPKYMFVKGDLATACPAIWLDARENTLCTSLALSGPGPAPAPPSSTPGNIPSIPRNLGPTVPPTPSQPIYKFQQKNGFLKQIPFESGKTFVQIVDSCDGDECEFYLEPKVVGKTVNIYNKTKTMKLGIETTMIIGTKRAYLFSDFNKKNVIFDFGYSLMSDGKSFKLSYEDSNKFWKQFVFNTSSAFNPESNIVESSDTIMLVKQSGTNSFGLSNGLSTGLQTDLSGAQQITRIVGSTVYYMKQLKAKPGIYDLQMVPADQCQPGDASCQFIVSGSTIKNQEGMQMVLTNAYGRLRAYMLAADLITVINSNVAGKPIGTSGDSGVLISDFTIQQGANSALTLQYTYNGAQWPFAVSNAPPDWPSSGLNTTMNIDIGQSAAGVMKLSTVATVGPSTTTTVEGFDNGHLSMLSGFGPLAPLNYNQLSEGFGPAASHKCHVENIPLQKWVHIAYVLDNRTTDIYVDGKLERSCVAPGVPLLNSEALSISPALGNSKPGFFGEYAKVQYFFNAIGPTDVARIYAAGPY